MVAEIRAMEGITRVTEGNTSRIVPTYSKLWSERKRLSWLLAVVELDHGLKATLYDSRYTIAGIRQRPTHWSISMPGVGLSSGTFNDVWRSLTDLGIGYELGRKAASK